MKDEELTKTIEDGIVNAVFRIIWVLVVCIFIVLLFGGLIVFVLNYYQNYQCTKNGNCMVPTMAMDNSCRPLPNLYCEVFVGNETDEVTFLLGNVCGYQEANAKFEQNKPFIQREIINVFDPHKKDNWKIKYLKCD